MSTALLIIDVQRALCSGEWAAFDIARVLARINALGARARAAGVPVVLIQHEEDAGPLRADSEGWQLADGLETAAGDLRLRKTTPDSFHRTGLQRLLAERGVDARAVCGLQSDFCVDTTVRRALALGFHVSLAADAHTTLDNGVLTAAQITAHHNATLAQMTGFGPRMAVVPAAEVPLEA
jgi:nicotinamidase-related amidase